MSSFGKETTETVVSETISAALCWIAWTIKFLASFSDCAFTSSVFSLINTARSCVNCSRVWVKIWSRACSCDKAATRSNSAWRCVISEAALCCCCSTRFCSLAILSSFLPKASSRFSKVFSLWSKVSSRWSNRSSCFWTSFRRCFNSASTSAR